MNLYLLEATEGPAPGRTHQLRIMAADLRHARSIAAAHARCNDTDPVDWIDEFEASCTLVAPNMPDRVPAGITSLARSGALGKP